MSTPPQSMNSNTPTPAYRNPNPARIARSTSSGVATPSSTRRTASFMRTTWRRDTMKPGASPQRTGVLPRCVRNVIVRSTTAADVAAPGTTSTSGMTWAGFNQCTTRNRSRAGTASARCMGEIVDDVEATIASSATRPVSRVKTSRLSSTDSGSASWTKPQLSTSARSVFFSSRRRHTRFDCDLEFRRVLFRSLQREVMGRDGTDRLRQRPQALGAPDPLLVALIEEPRQHAAGARDIAYQPEPGQKLEPVQGERNAPDDARAVRAQRVAQQLEDRLGQLLARPRDIRTL